MDFQPLKIRGLQSHIEPTFQKNAITILQHKWAFNQVKFSLNVFSLLFPHCVRFWSILYGVVMYKTIVFVGIDDCEYIPDNRALQWRINKIHWFWGGGGGGGNIVHKTQNKQPFYLNPKPSPQQPKPTRGGGGHHFIIVYKRRCMHQGRISFWNLWKSSCSRHPGLTI